MTYLPRRSMNIDNGIPCPWCGDNQEFDWPVDARKGDCTACQKSFEIVSTIENGIEAVGVMTAADRAYLEWQANR